MTKMIKFTLHQLEFISISICNTAFPVEAAWNFT